MKNLTIRSAQKQLGKPCEAILRTVPEWFGREDALQEYVSEIDVLDTYSAWLDEHLVGFMTVKYHTPESAELHVLAVDARFHRQGIGKQLLAFIEQDLKQKSVTLLQVKTLAESAGDVNYEKTRHFYSAQGFIGLEEFTELWGEDTPCLIMIKAL